MALLAARRTLLENPRSTGITLISNQSQHFMNEYFVCHTVSPKGLPAIALLKPYLVCSKEEVRKVVFWEGFCCFSCCIDSNWQPGTVRTKLQSAKSDIYKPLNIYVFGQQHFRFFYLNNSNVCVWDTAVRFCGSLITFH